MANFNEKPSPRFVIKVRLFVNYPRGSTIDTSN